MIEKLSSNSQHVIHPPDEKSPAAEILLQQNAVPQKSNQYTDFNKSEIEKKVETMNQVLESAHTNLKFELHEELERYYVAVVDSETQEVIKEIPPKKLLDAYAKMAEFMGLLVDERI
ncbi:flagellar protein FlaG [Terribacillus halophilus]|uniref:flagellar protein FlaG n=1 Tax=Terribacillus halophilus TaxID=361279 RepID=UPI0009845CB7|nr:flagellar protein FlaG [Terribacillus halophilus]